MSAYAHTHTLLIQFLRYLIEIQTFHIPLGHWILCKKDFYLAVELISSNQLKVSIFHPGILVNHKA